MPECQSLFKSLLIRAFLARESEVSFELNIVILNKTYTVNEHTGKNLNKIHQKILLEKISSKDF